MPKKVFIIIISILLLAAIPITLFVVQQQQELRQKAAPATTLSISPSQSTKAIGDEFQVNVVVDTGANSIIQVVVDLTYDATKLQFLSITNSPQFPNVVSGDPGSNPNGQIQEYIVATINPQTPFNGIGTVATIRFRAIGSTETPTSIRFTQNAAAYSLSEPTTPPGAKIGDSPATITITGSGTNPTPTPTTIATTITPTIGGATPTKTPTPTTPASGQPTAAPTATTAITPTTMPTATPTPTVGPLGLTITSPGNGSSTTDTTPTFSGRARAGINITMTFSPGGLTGVTTADASGNWTFTPTTALGLGVYTLSITGTDPVTGATQVINSVVTIGTVAPTSTPAPTQISSGNTPLPTQVASSDVPVTGTIETTIAIMAVGLVLLLGGALLPVLLKE